MVVSGKNGYDVDTVIKKLGGCFCYYIHKY
jgi:hypothetical protein